MPSKRSDKPILRPRLTLSDIICGPSRVADPEHTERVKISLRLMDNYAAHTRGGSARDCGIEVVQILRDNKKLFLRLSEIGDKYSVAMIAGYLTELCKKLVRRNVEVSDTIEMELSKYGIAVGRLPNGELVFSPKPSPGARLPSGTLEEPLNPRSPVPPSLESSPVEAATGGLPAEGVVGVVSVPLEENVGRSSDLAFCQPLVLASDPGCILNPWGRSCCFFPGGSLLGLRPLSDELSDEQRAEFARIFLSE